MSITEANEMVEYDSCACFILFAALKDARNPVTIEKKNETMLGRLLGRDQDKK